MAKQLQDRWFGTRVTNAFVKQVDDYLGQTDLNLADLLRQSVVEYMINHPVKKPQQVITKPGGE